ncbi:tetratricopeptide repeat protein [Oceanispirochaeta sp.]|jgi:tetratricopeptide (TPR) repeat protein|uniref:tetratricopeptide repeat protein n=1 Tax=Oceanispirochaeta sp. TaxID=2035350 RepID=UPI00262A235E|nr:tetratricopeptide repeat protein [Oceanispirochaeta sp.]MDA3955575.1 tetratricopeptide repeat protein [Oceanispirochaeta sp.]
MNIILLTVPLILVMYLFYRFRSFPLFIKAMKIYNTGDISKALKMLKDAVEAGLAAKYQLTVGYILLKEGYTEDAERIFTFLINTPQGKFNSNHARAYSALIHWKKGHLDEAIQELKTLLEEDYRTTALYSNLGFFLIEKGDLDKALEINLEAFYYDGFSPVILDNLGLCYIKREEWVKAEEIYEKLIKSDPGFPDAWYNAALVAIQRGDKEKAESLLNSALEKKFSYLSTLNKAQVEEQLQLLKG